MAYQVLDDGGDDSERAQTGGFGGVLLGEEPELGVDLLAEFLGGADDGGSDLAVEVVLQDGQSVAQRLAARHLALDLDVAAVQDGHQTLSGCTTSQHLPSPGSASAA